MSADMGIRRAARAGVILAFLRARMAFEPTPALRRLLTEPPHPDDLPPHGEDAGRLPRRRTGGTR